MPARCACAAAGGSPTCDDDRVGLAGIVVSQLGAQEKTDPQEAGVGVAIQRVDVDGVGQNALGVEGAKERESLGALAPEAGVLDTGHAPRAEASATLTFAEGAVHLVDKDHLVPVFVACRQKAVNEAHKVGALARRGSSRQQQTV